MPVPTELGSMPSTLKPTDGCNNVHYCWNKFICFLPSHTSLFGEGDVTLLDLRDTEVTTYIMLDFYFVTVPLFPSSSYFHLWVASKNLLTLTECSCMCKGRGGTLGNISVLHKLLMLLPPRLLRITRKRQSISRS